MHEQYFYVSSQDSQLFHLSHIFLLHLSSLSISLFKQTVFLLWLLLFVMKDVDHSYTVRMLSLNISWYSWAFLSSKAASHGISPNTFLWKLTSALLGLIVFFFYFSSSSPLGPYTSQSQPSHCRQSCQKAFMLVKGRSRRAPVTVTVCSNCLRKHYVLSTEMQIASSPLYCFPSKHQSSWRMDSCLHVSLQWTADTQMKPLPRKGWFSCKRHEKRACRGCLCRICCGSVCYFSSKMR